jgi:hypothetical protein
MRYVCYTIVSAMTVNLLMVLANTVIPGFNLLEIQTQDFYSLLDMYEKPG